MYGLPTDFDPQIFVGRELDAVTYAVGVIVMAFADQLTVSVSGRVPYRANGEADLAFDQQPVVETSLVSLVGQPVVAFELKSPRELILAFEGGGSLTLLDDSGPYESYLINTGDREIIV